MIALMCENNMDGVFSGIYEAWAGKYNRDELVLRTGGIGNYELFMEYRDIPVNTEHSCKVGRTLQRLFGQDTYESICGAVWSEAGDKADAVYRMVKYGIEHKLGYGLRNHLTNPAVERVFELSRSTWGEAHHYLGFIRFVRLESGVLYAETEAKNYVLEVAAAHFADRLPGNDWVIHDTGYDRAAVHPAGKEWFVIDGEQVGELASQSYAQGEEEIRQLWRNFCSSVSIQSRCNPKLQRQNLPLRFRSHMV